MGTENETKKERLDSTLIPNSAGLCPQQGPERAVYVPNSVNASRPLLPVNSTTPSNPEQPRSLPPESLKISNPELR